VAWPSPLADGTLLAGRAKGIYKPAWSKYALSIRRSLSGPYPDRDIELGADGTWAFKYFQEDLDPKRRDSQFTNVGLIECWKDVVPVGVLVQTAARPNPRYRVFGLALVTGWDEGYFGLEGGRGAVAVGEAFAQAPPESTDGPPPTVRADMLAASFDPTATEDRRREARRIVALRQGQQGFRRTLLSAYAGQCAITGYDAEDALEASHIVQYRGPVTNHPSNGLLLRADIHSLFDLGLLAIDSDSFGVILSAELAATSYRSALRGGFLRLPTDRGLSPSSMALTQHREWAGL